MPGTADATKSLKDDNGQMLFEPPVCRHHGGSMNTAQDRHMLMAAYKKREVSNSTYTMSNATSQASLAEKTKTVTITTRPTSADTEDIEKHAALNDEEAWAVDPENPMNWPLWKKAYHSFAAAILAFSVSCGASLITPSVFSVMADFDVTLTKSILVLTLFVLGLGLGPMVAAPISETWGRRVVYISTSIVYMLFTIGAGFSKTFTSLLVCRFFAGMAGGPVLAVGAGTNADMVPVRYRAVAAAFFILMPFLGPSLGPVIGAFVITNQGVWQWSQYATVLISLVALVLVLPMNETYEKIILKKRAKKAGLALPAEELTPKEKIKMLFTITLFRPIRMIFTEPIVSLFALYNALSFSILFSLFEAYPYVYMTVYGFNTWQYGLTFLGVGLGVLLAVPTALIVDHLYYQKRYDAAAAQGKSVDPEYRLLVGQIGSFGIPIGLFWFGWSARADVHWIVPTMAGIFFAWGNVCVFICAALYLVDVYGPLNGASALAANGLLRYSLAACFPLFVVQMYENLGIGWATSVFGFATIAMMPIPFVFFIYGPRIRAVSGVGTVI